MQAGRIGERMRWPITILASFISPLVLAGQQPPLASVPAASPTAGFQSVDIEGKTLRYHCQGAGSPTVIIEQGGGISVETVFSWKQPVGWAALAPRIASLTRICVYDRIGLGRSSKAERPRTSFDVADELHSLLDRERIHSPYVLAGQSLGGMNAIAFANRYRDEVVGLVLVDSSHPQQRQRINAVLPARSEDESDVMRGFRDGPDRAAMGGEWFDFDRNGREFVNNMTVGGIPLIVLTAAPQPPSDRNPLPHEWQLVIEPMHQQLQRELARLSTDSKHIVAQKAGHNIQLDEPELVFNAITDLVLRARRAGSKSASN
jgi:Predicted hydrolases or acyltransferases (alpha/beta hydrolase superfamily)|nr:alpha/beta hydrolase [uncultured Steroidobacter sp.]